MNLFLAQWAPFLRLFVFFFLCSKLLPSGVLFKIAVGFVFHFTSVCKTSLSPAQQVPLFAWKAILISSITVFWLSVQCVYNAWYWLRCAVYTSPFPFAVLDRLFFFRENKKSKQKRIKARIHLWGRKKQLKISGHLPIFPAFLQKKMCVVALLFVFSNLCARYFSSTQCKWSRSYWGTVLPFCRFRLGDKKRRKLISIDSTLPVFGFEWEK